MTTTTTTTTVDRDALIGAWQEAQRTQLDVNAAVRKAEQMLIAAEQVQRQATTTYEALRAILQSMPEEATS